MLVTCCIVGGNFTQIHIFQKGTAANFLLFLLLDEYPYIVGNWKLLTHIKMEKPITLL